MSKSQPLELVAKPKRALRAREAKEALRHAYKTTHREGMSKLVVCYINDEGRLGYDLAGVDEMEAHGLLGLAQSLIFQEIYG